MVFTGERNESSVAAMEMVEEGNNEHKITPKRIKLQEIVEEEDRMSALPDCLLLEVISRLPSTKTAIKTGTLSKRWKYLWTSVSTLIFQQDHRSDFISFVNKTLTQRRQLKLNKFELCTRYDIQFESEVNNWIRYAISCEVEELDLMLWIPGFKARFRLNEYFCINSCFTDLKLTCCIFNPIGSISWKRLRNLSLSFSNLDEGLIENILSGSPLLETLVLENCYGYERLNLTSKSLKNLVFSGYDDPHDQVGVDIIEINAPNLLSLTIQDNLILWKLVLLNVSSLVEANLKYTYINGGYWEETPEEDEEEMLEEFIQSLCHVKKLKIGDVCCEVLSRLEAKGFIIPSNVKLPDLTSFTPIDWLGQGDWYYGDSVESGDWEVIYLDHGPKGDECN